MPREKHEMQFSAALLQNQAAREMLSQLPGNAVVTVAGHFTPEEFAQMAGAEHDCRKFMRRTVAGPGGWNVTVCPEEVLACESDGAVQARVIAAAREKAGNRQTLKPSEIKARTRDCDDISIKALAFLLDLHDLFLYPDEDAGCEFITEAMSREGLTLDDFLRPE